MFHDKKKQRIIAGVIAGLIVLAMILAVLMPAFGG